MVEVSPPYDLSELTALAGAHIAQELVTLFRDRKVGAASGSSVAAEVKAPGGKRAGRKGKERSA